MKVIAKSLIKHNGNYYQTGDVLPDMSEKELSTLVASNVVTIKDGKVAPAKPDDANSLPSDKTLEAKAQEETANMPIAITMKKSVLIGIARANGLKVEQTVTPAEAYKMIKEYREKAGIVVEDAKPAKKVVADNPEAPKKKEDSAPSGAEDKK